MTPFTGGFSIQGTTHQTCDQNLICVNVNLILNIALTKEIRWALNGNRTLYLLALNSTTATKTTANVLSFSKLNQLFSFLPLEHYISTGTESFVVFLWEVAISFCNHPIRRYQTFLSLDLGDIVSERHSVRLQTSNGLFTRSGNSLVAGRFSFRNAIFATRSVTCVSRTLWDENLLRSKSFFSWGVFILQVHSPVPTGQRSSELECSSSELPCFNICRLFRRHFCLRSYLRTAGSLLETRGRGMVEFTRC